MNILCLFSPKKRIAALSKKIRDHDRHYFVNHAPDISDYAYDRLMARLKRLERRHPAHRLPDSPTQRMGDRRSGRRKKVEHGAPMLSMNNTYSSKGLKHFNKKIKFLLDKNSIDYICELKIDGVAVNLRYEYGQLATAATRGDGKSGDDVTAAVKSIKGIPLRLEKDYTQIKRLEIRGEVYISRRDFEAINRKRAASGKKAFATPRNLAAGSLKLSRVKEIEKRHLQFYAYAIGEHTHSDSETNTQKKQLSFLNAIGFNVNKNAIHCKTIADITAYCKRWEKKRDALPYDIDGIVVKVNSIRSREKIGHTKKAELWQIAYKFRPKAAQTQVLEIEYRTGPTGKITPVAILQPVDISGSRISKCSLHNEDFVWKHDIMPGDTVVIKKTGDAVPQFEKVIHRINIGEVKDYDAYRI